MNTLLKKPGALHGSKALEQAPLSIKELYHRYFEKEARGFIDILLYCKNNQISHEKLINTVNKVSEICFGEVSVDKVVALLGNRANSFELSKFKEDKRDEIEALSLEQLKEISRLTEYNINQIKRK